MMKSLKNGANEIRLATQKSGRKPGLSELKKQFSARIKVLKLLRIISSSYMPLKVKPSSENLVYMPRLSLRMIRFSIPYQHLT